MKRRQLIHLEIIFTTGIMIAVRSLVGLVLSGLLVFQLLNHRNPDTYIGMLLLFLIGEVFIRTKVSHTYPTKTADESQVVADITSHTAFLAYTVGQDAYTCVQRLFREPPVQFFLTKSQIAEIDIKTVAGEKEKLFTSALAITKSRKGRYVTSFDVIAAYLLITEPETKLLFRKELHESDIVAIVRWTALVYPHEEESGRVFPIYQGDGIGELLVFGWTPETQKYTTDLMPMAISEHFPIVGRSTEWELIIGGLQKPEDNNVLLLGEPGVGKEQLVRDLAYQSMKGLLPKRLNHCRVLELRIGQLLAGATDGAKMQERLQSLISEVSHAGNVILFIPDLEHILGSASFHTDLSGALLPYLRDGSLSIIATMTSQAYKNYVEGKGLADVFTIVTVEESDPAIVQTMLFEKAQTIEHATAVHLSYSSVQAAIMYAKHYKVDSVLPGSAIHLLEDAAATCPTSTVLTREQVVAYVEKQTHVPLGMPNAPEKNALLHLEDTLHQRVIGQDAAVNALANAMRRIRTGISEGEKPTSFLFLGPTGVGKTETAKALARAYFGGEEQIIRLDMSEYTSSDALNRLLGAAPGEGEERGDLTEKLHDNPNTLLLLDEFEKASREVHNLFLQVLADGRLTDNKGRTVHLQNTIIVATSNAGAEYIREQLQTGQSFDAAGQYSLLDYLQREHIFTPELLNRFDSVIVFKPLTLREGVQVVTLLLTELGTLLAHQDITLTFTGDVAARIAKDGMDPQFGARPLRRFITNTIEDQIAQKELTGDIHRGSHVGLSIDSSGSLALHI